MQPRAGPNTAADPALVRDPLVRDPKWDGHGDGKVNLRRVAVIGAGPAGLFLARLIKLRQPDVDVELYERGGPDEAFGFGVVLSDHTLTGVRAADAETYERVAAASVAWGDVRVA